MLTLPRTSDVQAVFRTKSQQHSLTPEKDNGKLRLGVLEA